MAMTSNKSSKKGKPGSSLYLSALPQLLLLLAASALLAIIVFTTHLTNQAQAVSQKRGPLSRLLIADVSSTLTVLRAFQGLLTTGLAAILSQTFSYLHWGHLYDPQGAPYIRQLALSPTTSFWGMVSLVTHRSPTLGSRCWALTRLFLILIVWLGGVVLFCEHPERGQMESEGKN
jgi:hypothetical protein